MYTETSATHGWQMHTEPMKTNKKTEHDWTDKKETKQQKPLSKQVPHEKIQRAVNCNPQAKLQIKQVHANLASHVADCKSSQAHNYASKNASAPVYVKHQLATAGANWASRMPVEQAKCKWANKQNANREDRILVETSNCT